MRVAAAHTHTHDTCNQRSAASLHASYTGEYMHGWPSCVTCGSPPVGVFSDCSTSAQYCCLCKSRSTVSRSRSVSSSTSLDASFCCVVGGSAMMMIIYSAGGRRIHVKVLSDSRSYNTMILKFHRSNNEAIACPLIASASTGFSCIWERARLSERAFAKAPSPSTKEIRRILE